jgi:hypothetical protein
MIGRGSATVSLSEQDVRAIASEFVERERLGGRRVLAIIPDQTRSGPIDLMFRTLYDLLAARPRSTSSSPSARTRRCRRRRSTGGSASPPGSGRRSIRKPKSSTTRGTTRAS